jgi:hypothetical protein
MQIEIPSDIQEIMEKAPLISGYDEFMVEIAIDEGKVFIRDGIGVWANDLAFENLEIERAWRIMRKWWADEAESRKALEVKTQLEFQIMMKEEEVHSLKETIKALDKKAETKKWFW